MEYYQLKNFNNTTSSRCTYLDELLFAVHSNDYQEAKRLLDKHGLILDEKYLDYTILIHALQEGNKKMIILLLNYGCRVNPNEKVAKITNKFSTPLYHAVQLGNFEIIKTLLTKGASIINKGSNTETALCLAMKKQHFNIVDLMLSMYHTENIDPSNHDEIIHFNIACIRNSVSLLKTFIEKKMNVNVFVDFNHGQWPGYTPLHFAVQNQSVEAVELLLDCGANFGFKNAENMSPLHFAYYYSRVGNNNSLNSIKNEEIMDMILNAHIKKVARSVGDNKVPTLCIIVNPVDGKGISHFHIACTRNDQTVIKKFLECKVEINSQISSESNILGGYSPLHIAVKYNHRKTVELLLKYNVDINIQDSMGWAPLHLAVECKCNELIQLLLEHNADVSVKDKEDCTVLHRAFLAKTKDNGIIDLLLSVLDEKPKNCINKYRLSHFHIACTRNNLGLVRKFLESGVNVDANVDMTSKNWPGYTALHFASHFNRIDIVQLLVEHKANVNILEENGLTPLSLACRQDYHKFTELFENCSDNTQNNLKNIAEVMEILKWEVCLNKQILIVELLLKYQSDVNCKDKLGKPLLFDPYVGNVTSKTDSNNRKLILTRSVLKQLSIGRKKVICALLNHNIDFNILDSKGDSILHLIASSYENTNPVEAVEIAEVFLNKGIDVNVQNKAGHTPLYVAVVSAFREVASIFLKYNADPNIVEHSLLCSPLHSMIFFSGNNDPHDRNSLKIAELLISKGANVNAKNRKGHTPLFLAAAQENSSKILSYLLQNECDVNIQNNAGQTALYTAIKKNNISGLIQLLDYGADINIIDNKDVSVVQFLWTLLSSNTLTKRIISEIYLEVFKILEEHIQKLILINFYISKSNKLYYKRLRQSYMCMFKLYDYDDQFYDEMKDDDSDDYNLCDEDTIFDCECELEEMKNIKVDNYTSLSDILYKDSQEMAKHVKNETFKEFLDHKRLKDQFPMYGFAFRMQYKKGMARYALLESAKESLQLLTKFNLIDCCIDKIFSFLSDEDLRILIRSKF